MSRRRKKRPATPREPTPTRPPRPSPPPARRELSRRHAAQYAAWRGSTHGRAGSAPPDERHVIAPFDGTPIRFRDAVVTPRAARRRLTFTVAQENRPPRTF